ncbi:tyrosine recombinase XerC [Bacteroidia bacterium]|nr:tyrosine recombinase XerC [Bacteroidia bacterium]
MNRLRNSFIEYLKYERKYSDCTIQAYAKDLDLFEVYVKENQESVFDHEVIDADIVRNWIIHLLDNKAAPSSVNRKLSSLKSFFKFLVKQGVISTNPLRFVVGPKTKKPLPVFIRETDMNEILDGDGFKDDFEGVRNRLILELFYDTGIRRSELVGIRNADIDYPGCKLRVTGKGDKQRLIPFAENLKKRMIAYKEIRDREIGTESEWFFIRKNGNPLSVSIIYGIVKKSLSGLTTLPKRSPHVLRHSFATSMLNNGAELNAIKELLGHSSLATTNVYTHTTFEELKKVYHAHPRAKKEGGFYGH